MSVEAVASRSLSRSEQVEMLEYLPEHAVEFRGAGLAPGELGEPGTAIAIVSLSMLAITGLCAWLAAQGRGVSLGFRIKAPGLESEVSLTISDQSTPALVRQELNRLGVSVPEA